MVGGALKGAAGLALPGVNDCPTFGRYGGRSVAVTRVLRGVRADKRSASERKEGQTPLAPSRGAVRRALKPAASVPVFGSS